MNLFVPIEYSIKILVEDNIYINRLGIWIANH